MIDHQVLTPQQIETINQRLATIAERFTLPPRWKKVRISLDYEAAIGVSSTHQNPRGFARVMVSVRLDDGRGLWHDCYVSLAMLDLIEDDQLIGMIVQQDIINRMIAEADA